MEAFRSAGDNTASLFPGPVSEWTADQKRLVALTKEYTAVFSTLASRGHEIPGDKILANYRKFREWWSAYQEEPEIAENPYKKYNHGFSVRQT